MTLSMRGLAVAGLFALVGCFSESSTADDGATGDATDPTLTTTTVDPPTTSMGSATSSSTSGDPTSATDPSVDSTGTSDSDTEPGTTTDPTDGCPAPGEPVCDDGLAVAGELCFLEPESKNGGDDQLGALAIADIDDDGVPDLAFVDGADGFVSFAAGGELQNASPVVGGLPTWSVDVGPLGDAIAVAYGGVNAEVYVVRFDGQAFDVDPPLGAPGPFATARFVDVDGDNALDLLVAAEASATLHLHVNDGSGAFAAVPQPIELGAVSGVSDMRILHDARATSPGLAILAFDGRLLWSRPGDAGFSMFEQLDAMTFGDQATGRLAAGDLDADGDTDVVVGFDGRAFVFRATDLGFMAPQTLGSTEVGIIVPAIVDVDNDGFADVISADPGETELEIYVADDDGFAAMPALQTPAMPRGVGAADFDGDCAADVVALGPDWFEVARSNP